MLGRKNNSQVHGMYKSINTHAHTYTHVRARAHARTQKVWVWVWMDEWMDGWMGSGQLEPSQTIATENSEAIGMSSLQYSNI